MSVLLKDQTGNHLPVDVWNWAVLHHALASSIPPIITDGERLARLRHNSHAEISPEEVKELLVLLKSEVLPKLGPGARMLSDFSVTDQPDDGTFHRENLDKNYALTYETLVKILAFLEHAHGRVTVA